jgi:hypothetical protein
MRKDMPTAAEELAMPWARRRWAAVEHMAVRGWSRRPGATPKCRPVAGRMAGSRDSVLKAASMPGSFARPMPSLGSGSPLFVKRVAGHEPAPTGLVPLVVASPVVEPQAAPVVEAPRATKIVPAFPQPPVLARHAVPLRPFATEPSLEDPAMVRMRRLPVPPAREFIAPTAYPSLFARLRVAALTRWRDWLLFSNRPRLPREVDWAGWRDRVEPTLLASFALIASAAALIGLYSFSNSGMYNPITALPSQTNAAPPGSPVATVAPGVRAIHPAPGVQRGSGSSGSVPQPGYVSWPAPYDPTFGQAGQSSQPAQAAGGAPKVTRTSAAGGGAAGGGGTGGGGGGGHPASSAAASPTPSPSPSPSESTVDPTPSPSETTVEPTPSETTTPPVGP